MLVAFSGNSPQTTEPAAEALDKEQVKRMKRMKRTILRSALALAIAALFGITVKAKKTLRCSKCGDEGHNAKTCPSPQQQISTE